MRFRDRTKEQLFTKHDMYMEDGAEATMLRDSHRVKRLNAALDLIENQLELIHEEEKINKLFL